MGRRISKEFLHPSILEGVNDKIGNLDSLETDAKDNMVQAINELADKIDIEIAEGKELIANAVGEPLTAEESFDEMSNDINSLLSTFKTNMMNNGITVESSDKFKSLIDKIATLTDNEGKGIQFASGTYTTNGGAVYNTDIVVPLNLSFDPTYLFVETSFIYYNTSYNEKTRNFGIVSNIDRLGLDRNSEDTNNNTSNSEVYLTNITRQSCQIDGGSSGITISSGTYNWYAIGVGEEDTTLRDSLASILQEEGVSVTEEDDMASLIGKVDEEFNNRPLPSLGDLSGVNHDFLFDISASGSTATVVSGYSIPLTGDYELIFDWSGPTINALRSGYVNIFKNNVSIKQYTLSGTRDGSYTFTFSAVKGDVLKITITGEGYSSSVSNLRLRGNLIF